MSGRSAPKSVFFFFFGEWANVIFKTLLFDAQLQSMTI